MSKSLGAPPMQLALGTHVGKHCSLPGQPFTNFVYNQQATWRAKHLYTCYQSAKQNDLKFIAVYNVSELVFQFTDALYPNHMRRSGYTKKENPDIVLQFSKMNVATVQA